MTRETSAVLVVEDDAALREALCETLELAGYRPVAAADGATALALLEQEPVGLVVSDVQMAPMDGHALLRALKARRPELPVVLMTAYGTIEKAVAAMRDGAVDYLVKPFGADALEALVGRHLIPQLAAGEVVAADPVTVRLLEIARRVAATEATVVITGESGTGKEVFARYLHACSPRAAAPFVAINCAAIPEQMLEAVLFGHEKGAFTGALQALPGKFEQAQGGTLLLDEIAEMELGLQAKLLRVLQEREVERIGGRRPIALDVRVIATTNRDLRQEVAAGRFREDLAYRLNVFPLHLPPLRERPLDILPLARHLLQRRAHGARASFTAAAERRLAAHPWPGNVRELDNVIQRALILRSGEAVDVDALVFEPVSGVAAAPATVPTDDGLGADLMSREHELIVRALEEVRGSRKDAAARLGISPRTLRYKLARLRAAGLAVPG